jgi:hypothetical protein
LAVTDFGATAFGASNVLTLSIFGAAKVVPCGDRIDALELDIAMHVCLRVELDVERSDDRVALTILLLEEVFFRTWRGCEPPMTPPQSGLSVAGRSAAGPTPFLH